MERAPKPSFLQGRGGHRSTRRVQWVRGPNDTGLGGPGRAPDPGVGSRPPRFLLSIQFSGAFISKRVAHCSLLHVSPEPGQTPQGQRECISVCIEVGGRGRGGALTPRLCSECGLGSQRQACRAPVLALTRSESLNSRNEKVPPVTLTLLGGAGGGFCRFVLCWGWENPQRKN